MKGYWFRVWPNGIQGVIVHKYFTFSAIKLTVVIIMKSLKILFQKYLYDVLRIKTYEVQHCAIP